jgi:hypothetical protein
VEFTVLGVDKASDKLDDVAESAQRSSRRISDASDDAASAFDRSAEGADTLASKGSQAAGALSGLGDLIGGPFGGAMQVGGVAMQAAADSGDLLNFALEGGRAAAAALSTGVGKVVTALKLDKAAKGVATAAQWAWNAAVSANPLGLIVIAITAVVAGLVLLATKTKIGKQIVTAAWSAIKATASSVAHFFTHTVPAAFGKVTGAARGVMSWVRKNWPLLLAIITGPIGLAVYAVTKNWDTIKAGARAAKDYVVGRFHALTSFMKGLPGSIGRALGGVASAITAPFRAAFNSVAGLWNGSVGRIHFNVPSWVPGLGGKGFSFPQIPYLATGGTIARGGWAVVGEKGSEMVSLPTGARVYPHNRPPAATNQAPSVHIEHFHSEGMTPAQVAKELEWEWRKP